MSTQPAEPAPPSKSSVHRTRRWRERMRAKGLTPRTVWSYDVRDPAFIARLRADFAALSAGDDEGRVMRELEQMYELDEPIPAWVEQPGDHEAR